MSSNFDPQERIKKEMRGANRYEGMAEVDYDEEDDDELTNTGKDIKKLVRKNDKSGAYDSDDDVSVSIRLFDARCPVADPARAFPGR